MGVGSGQLTEDPPQTKTKPGIETPASANHLKKPACRPSDGICTSATRQNCCSPLAYAGGARGKGGGACHKGQVSVPVSRRAWRSPLVMPGVARPSPFPLPRLLDMTATPNPMYDVPRTEESPTPSGDDV